MMAPTPDVAKEGGMMDYKDGCYKFVERWKGEMVERWKGGKVPP